MAIRFRCACGEVIVTEDEHAGRKGRCPGCGAVVRIPPRSTVAAAPKPAEAATTPASAGGRAQPPAATGSPRKGGRKVILGVALGGGVLVVAGVALGLIYGLGGPERPAKQPGPGAGAQREAAKVAPARAPAEKGDPTLEKLLGLYETRGLDLAGDTQAEDLRAVLDGLQTLWKSADAATAARARLMRYVLAIEASMYFSMAGPIRFPLGLLPAGEQAAIRQSALRGKILKPHEMQSFLRMPGLAVVVAKAMGATMPDDPALAGAAADERVVRQQVSVLMSLLPKLRDDWAAQLRAIPDEQLGDLADEKAATLAFLAATRAKRPSADDMRAMHDLARKHPASRWADDADATWIEASANVFGRIVEAQGTPGQEAKEWFDTMVDLVGARAQWDRISQSGTGWTDVLFRCVQSAIVDRHKEFAARHPASPWKLNLELSLVHLWASQARGPATRPGG